MGGLQGQLLYFAYGADLRRDIFMKRCPGADWLGLARMEDQRFVIGVYGTATVREEAGAIVWGALWLVPAAELATLDRMAGVEDGRSERTTRRVISPAGPRTEAMMYVSSPAESAGVDTAAHMAEVIEGARANRLPAAYIKELQTCAKVNRRTVK